MLTPEGKESLHADEIEVLGNFITAQVVGGAYAAMDNFGKGSLMDENNPALESYKNSGLWNPVRHDTTIRGRPKGQYTNIFGETETSTAIITLLGVLAKTLTGVTLEEPPSTK